MKYCKSCGTEKPESEFHKRAASKDGLSAKCKECQKAYDKARANLPHRVKSRQEYQRSDHGSRVVREVKKRWAKNNKDKVYRSTRRYREKYPNKYVAHGKVAYEIKVGNLVREPCEICGREDGVHAHHDDYSKPLNIRWLCTEHHNQWHKENGEGLNA